MSAAENFAFDDVTFFQYFTVPSSNKRDLRSIEQTLNDMRSRKKPRLDSDGDNEHPNGVASRDT